MLYNSQDTLLHMKPSIVRIVSVDEKLAEELNGLFDEGVRWSDTEGAAFLRNDDNALFVAFVDSRAVGFATAHRLQRMDRRKAEVLLYEIGVHEDFRKRGIAKAIVQSVNAWAATKGADETWVLTEAENTAARALYASAGEAQLQKDIFMFTYSTSSA